MYGIRPATDRDILAMLAIYAPYITETSITFETEVPSSEDFSQRLAQIQKKYPWLVLEEDKAIVGYAYATYFKQRSAYDWSLETSIYLSMSYRGRGYGKILYQALLSAIKSQGIVNAVGVIALPNEPSIALHESLGFHKVAHFPKIGFKMNQWWDVGYWQLALK